MEIKKLKEQANIIRKDIIEMLVEAKSGHSAGPLGMADVFTALYFGDVLKHDPKNPKWEQRDRLVLSNGHICPVHYATLARVGYFPIEELKTLRKLGSRLQGHPHNAALPGIETSSGPLGQGISQAIGMALAVKMDKKKNQIYVISSDGEHDEGQTWEAIMFAGKNKMDNLTNIMDRNNIQIDGFTEDVMPLEPLRDKYEAFGWHVIDIDGHNIQEIIDACNQAKAIFEKPVVILAHTIPGKGVDFMEFDFKWHGKAPCAEEGQKALDCLRTLDGKIKGEHE
ncbi:MAG: transketolase [Parcubacteria group bacterium]|jgi:transketolase|nr:transketolase [Parcubacteria group bacterium]|tara:strand:+ start:12320 stop:13165 length:846 start_codon:yes stop_codon:yes gene_type:complete